MSKDQPRFSVNTGRYSSVEAIFRDQLPQMTKVISYKKWLPLEKEDWDDQICDVF